MISQLAHEINDSPTLALAQKTRPLKANGGDIVDLWTGHLDYEPPQSLKDDIKTSFDNDDIAKYIPVAGLPALRELIANKSQEYYNTPLSSSNILIWSGAKTILYITFLSIINPWDEVIVIAPYRPSYIEQIKLVWWFPVIVQSDLDCHLDTTQIAKHITSKTKCIIVNSPNNPSGVVYQKKEWDMLLGLVTWKDIYLVSDEMYKDFTFDGTYTSPLMLADESLKKNIIVVDGLSKNIAIPWRRVWWAIADAAIISAMSKIQSNMTGNTTSIIQHGLVKFFSENDWSFVDQMRNNLIATRNSIKTHLDHSDIWYINPAWSLYFFIRIPTDDSIGFCEQLLEKWWVSAVPGVYFGREWYIRICYAMDPSMVEYGIQRVTAFITN